uniref:Uncharacterized protein n=1 Tax=Anguilla anguilla TaxID=7936 RepID=A0A0E9PQ72_ANGAN
MSLRRALHFVFKVGR